MIKWLWYLNIFLVVVAGGIAAIGMSRLPELSDHNSSTSKKGAKNTLSNALNSDDGDSELSPLVAATEAFSERWEPPQGWVRIKIEPEEVLQESPKWRLSGGIWYESGQKSRKIGSGKHLVSFSDTENWNPPQPIEVDVSRKSLTEKTVRYTKKPPPEYGKIRVVIDPCDVRALDARWRINNGPWLESGQTSDNILVGKAAITFKPISDWRSPAGQTVEIKKDEIVELNAAYVKIPKPVVHYGSLKVIIEPQKAVEAGAQWRLKNQPDKWYDSGAVLELKTDNYEIDFKPPGNLWKPPKTIALVVQKDKTIERTVTYEEIKPPGPKSWVIKGTFSSGDYWGCVFLQTPSIREETCFFLGDEIEGFTLKSVNDGAIVVTKNDFEYELKMPSTERSAISGAPTAPSINPQPPSPPSQRTRVMQPSR